jgi:hypothetical protein
MGAAPLPAGYIRTDVDTVATYDGTFWVLNREIEEGSNANGQFVRFETGLAIMHGSDIASGPTDSATGSLFRSAELSHDYPISVSLARVNITVASATKWANALAIGGGSVQYRHFSSITSAASGTTRFNAVANWY